MRGSCTNSPHLFSFMSWLPWLPLWAVIVASNSWAGASEAGVTLETNIFSREDGVPQGWT